MSAAITRRTGAPGACSAPLATSAATIAIPITTAATVQPSGTAGVTAVSHPGARPEPWNSRIPMNNSPMKAAVQIGSIKESLSQSHYVIARVASRGTTPIAAAMGG